MKVGLTAWESQSDSSGETMLKSNFLINTTLEQKQNDLKVSSILLYMQVIYSRFMVDYLTFQILNLLCKNAVTNLTQECNLF